MVVNGVFKVIAGFINARVQWLVVNRVCIEVIRVVSCIHEDSVLGTLKFLLYTCE